MNTLSKKATAGCTPVGLGKLPGDSPSCGETETPRLTGDRPNAVVGAQSRDTGPRATRGSWKACRHLEIKRKCLPYRANSLATAGGSKVPGDQVGTTMIGTRVQEACGRVAGTGPASRQPAARAYSNLPRCLVSSSNHPRVRLPDLLGRYTLDP